MPRIVHQFGAYKGNSNQDLRAIIHGPGSKNALILVASYQKDGLNNFTEANFWGRLIVYEGESVDPTNDVASNDAQLDVLPKVLLDVSVHGIGPHTFLLPIAQTEGGIQTSSGGTISILLCKATAGAGETFTPFLTVAGQTLTGAA